MSRSNFVGRFAKRSSAAKRSSLHNDIRWRVDKKGDGGLQILLWLGADDDAPLCAQIDVHEASGTKTFRHLLFALQTRVDVPRTKKAMWPGGSMLAKVRRARTR